MGIFPLFGPPSNERFARMIAAEVRKAGEPATLRFDADAFRLVSSGNDGQLFYPANLYREYRNTPRGARSRMLRRMVRSGFDHRGQMPEDFGDVARDLLPIVRSRSFFEQPLGPRAGRGRRPHDAARNLSRAVPGPRVSNRCPARRNRYLTAASKNPIDIVNELSH